MAAFNPYVGPRRFEEADSNLFFGRDYDVESLLALILSQRLVLFYAPSGAGKSSLLRAKLIPRLRDEEQFEILPIGRVSGAETSTDATVDNIFVYNLIQSLEPPESTIAHEPHTSLLDYLAQHQPEIVDGATTPRFLIIDQFEEIVTTNLERWEDREGFFQQLRDALNQDPWLWVLLVMREDYAPELDPYTSVLPGRLRSRYYMRRMDETAAREAITKPAEIGGRTFSAEATTALIDNLRQIIIGDGKTGLGEFIEPVQLQVVCYQLWRNLEGTTKNEISLEDLQSLGDVDQALADYYEQSIASVILESGCAEADIRNWFGQKLITPQGTRGKVYHGAADTAGLPNTIVEALARRYLLRAEVWAGGTWYELVHDRFVDPIRHSNQEWLAHQSPIYQIAAEWDRTGRPESMLLSGDILHQAVKSTDFEHAQSIVTDFLRASEKAEENRILLETAEADRLRAQRLRRLLVGASIILIFALVGYVSAFLSRQRAEENRQIAESNLVTATVALGQAEIERRRAEENELLANTARETVAVGATAIAISRDEAIAANQTVVAGSTAIAMSRDNEVVARQTAEAGATAIAVKNEELQKALDDRLAAIEAANSAVDIASSNPFVISTSSTDPGPVVTSNQSELQNIQATLVAITNKTTVEIGQSAGGLPIQVQQYGSSEEVILLVGGVSGGFSPSSTRFAERVVEYYDRFSNEIPFEISLHVITNLNPDSPLAPGQVTGRLNANGVDITRNFDCAWSDTDTFRGADISNGSGPFSEPESQALRDYILSVNPVAVIFSSARADPSLVLPGFCNDADSGSVDLAATYAGGSGYTRSAVARSGTGDPSDWATTLEIPAIFILLPEYETFSEDDWQANLKGLKAVLSSFTQAAD
jgi:hypothetical protein